MFFWIISHTHGHTTHDIASPWAPVGAKKTVTTLITIYLNKKKTNLLTFFVSIIKTMFHRPAFRSRDLYLPIRDQYTRFNKMVHRQLFPLNKKSSNSYYQSKLCKYQVFWFKCYSVEGTNVNIEVKLFTNILEIVWISSWLIRPSIWTLKVRKKFRPAAKKLK